MAFDVTPTSGTAPYTFTAEFTNKDSIGLGYDLRCLRADAQSGACPLPEDATINLIPPADTLLEVGTYTRQVPVPAGSCQTFVLAIRDRAGNVVDSQSVNVDNV